MYQRESSFETALTEYVLSVFSEKRKLLVFGPMFDLSEASAISEYISSIIM